MQQMGVPSDVTFVTSLDDARGRLTTPSIVSTSFIADTMPVDSQPIKMTSPRAYAIEAKTRAQQA